MLLFGISICIAFPKYFYHFSPLETRRLQFIGLSFIFSLPLGQAVNDYMPLLAFNRSLSESCFPHQAMLLHLLSLEVEVHILSCVVGIISVSSCLLCSPPLLLPFSIHGFCRTQIVEVCHLQARGRNLEFAITGGTNMALRMQS